MGQPTEFQSKIDKRSAGLTLLDYLCGCIPHQPRPKWLSLLQTGQVFVNGQPESCNIDLALGYRISYWIDDYQEPKVPLDWSVLWQNHELLALHKPAELPVSRTTRNIEHNLIRLVQRDSPWPDAHLLHRLDKETSGIILLAKSKAAAQLWQPKLEELMVRKVYRAVVWGEPHWDELRYGCRLSTRPQSPIRCQMHICQGEESGKIAISHFKVLEKFEGGFSLVECELFTGRKHQLRAQLAALGHPIVGDKIYAHDGEYFLKRCEDALFEEDWSTLKTPHHLLHASRIYLGQDINTWVEDVQYPPAWHRFIDSIS